MILVIAIMLALTESPGAPQQAQRELDQRLARVLTRTEFLTNGDHRALNEAGDIAFPRIHKAVLERIRAARKSPTDANQHQIDLGIEALTICAATPRTAKMIELTKLVDVIPRNRLYRWLEDEGDPKLVGPVFKAGLKQKDDGWYDQRRASCVSGLVRIGDEGAVDALIAALRDDETPIELKGSIFRQISRTRQPRALAVVRKLLDERRPPVAPSKDIKPEYSMTDVEYPVLQELDGETWALFPWRGLGSTDDLWIAKMRGGRLVEPLFTGVSEYWPMVLPSASYTEGGEEHEAMIEKLAAGEWMEKFVKNPALRADTDGDGLTDTAERWLGLDPNKADSDGDKTPDAMDKNPLTPRRQLSDEEAALRVACEVLTAGEDGRNIFVEFPEGIKPIELQLHQGVVFPSGPEYKSKMTRPGAVFGVRFSIKGPFMKGDTASFKYNVSGGSSWSGGVIEVVKIDGRWYPHTMRAEFWAAA